MGIDHHKQPECLLLEATAAIKQPQAMADMQQQQ